MLVAAVVLALMTQAGSRLDEAALRPSVNLVSNCSFEAVDEKGMPLAWELDGAAADFRMANRNARHGARCLIVASTASDAATPSARQTITIAPGVEYVLSGWLRVDQTDGKPIAAVLQFRDSQHQELASYRAEWTGEAGKWAPVEVRAKTPPAATEAVVIVPSMTGAAEVAVDAMSLRRVDGKTVQTEPIALSGLTVAYAQPDWIRLQWTSNAASHRLEWQPTKGKGPWQHADDVAEKTYSVVGLKPATQFCFRVTAAPPLFYDEAGKQIVPAKPSTAEIVASTSPAQPRVWAGFSLQSSAPLGALPPGTSYPAIECGGDRLYVAEIRDGAIYVSRIVPGTLAVEWTKVVVDREAGTWRGMTDLAWQEDKLWITWTARPASTPDGRQRQYVSVFDPATGERGKIVEIRPSHPGASTGPGGLAPREAQMWLTYLQSWTENGAERSQIAMASLDADGDPGEPVVCDNCPSPRPDGPCLANFDGDLELLYSDRAGLGERVGWEPLRWERFNGESYSGARTIGGSGRCRYPKALSLGRVTLAAYMANARWLDYGERFYDVVLVKLGPGAGDIDTISYADDMKYNANPDLTMYKGTIYVVFTKLEHAPEGGPAPKSYGTYLGKIEQELEAGGG
jgi:hypothetical protein